MYYFLLNIQIGFVDKSLKTFASEKEALKEVHELSGRLNKLVKRNGNLDFQLSTKLEDAVDTFGFILDYVDIAP